MTEVTLYRCTLSANFISLPGVRNHQAMYKATRIVRIDTWRLETHSVWLPDER